MTFIETFVANLIPPVVLVGMVVSIVSLTLFILTFTAVRGRVSGMHAFVKEHGLLLGGIVALSATAGSLFYSEILGYTPCPLCWYQRILMYPIVALFAVAIVAKARDVYKYVLALSIPGFVLATYHYLVQVYELTTSCIAPGGRELEAAQCTMRYVFDFGFMSIPFMAAVAFLLITLISLLALRRDVSRRDR